MSLGHSVSPIHDNRGQLFISLESEFLQFTEPVSVYQSFNILTFDLGPKDYGSGSRGSQHSTKEGFCDRGKTRMSTN